jgi:ankyrin repeat protein
MRIRWSLASVLVWLASVSVAAAGGSDSRLLQSLERGDTAAARALVKQGTDVNAQDAVGKTPLHRAVELNDVDLAKALIKAGARVKAATRYGVTPLHLACVNGQAAMIDLLLQSGADPDETWTYGETALMVASRTGVVDAVRVLLAHGANVNARTESGQTALMWAAAENNVAVIPVLLKAGADVQARTGFGFTALFFAVREGKLDAVRTLIAAGADVNDQLRSSRPPSFSRESAAAVAALGHLDGTLVKETQADASRAMMKNSYHAPDGDSVVAVAIVNSKYDIARFLVEHGANPNARDPRGSLLHAIAFMRRPGDHFPAQGGDPAPQPVGDSLELAKALLKHGANPNLRINWEEWPFDIDAFMTRTPLNIHVGRTYLSQVGATPYYLAARHGDLELMKVLLDGGADPKIPTIQNVTPLMAAAGLGFLEGETPGPTHQVLGTSPKEAFDAVKLAYERDPDSINTAADFGEIPPFKKSGPEYLYEVVPNLDNKGKALGDLRWAGSTALHGAALRGQTDIIQFLVDKGAKLDAKNRLGWTPLMVTGTLMIGATAKSPRFEARALLTKLMRERGLEASEAADQVASTPSVSKTAAAGAVAANPR